MTRIAVLGAGGQTGQALEAELVGAGHDVVALPTGASDRAVAEALMGTAALIDLAGPDASRDLDALETAAQAGVHYLDASLEPVATARVHAQHARLRAAGVTAVSAAGFPDALLDLLAASAVASVDDAREVHLATTFLDRGWLRAAGPRTRAALARLLGEPLQALVSGRLVEEPIGEARRLAWFPRPVGLAHAAGVPASAPLSVARRDPDLTTVRAYLAMSGWRAELLQLAGNAMGWGAARRRLDRLVRGPGTPPAAERARSVRWACVAETKGAQGTARAWANGSDPAAAAAASLTVLLAAVLANPRPGAHTPAQLAPAGALLDDLTATRDLRWALIRPEA